MSMSKWLVIGGVGTLVYLLATAKGGFAAIRPGGKAQPQPQGAPAQKPLPPAQPQTTIVPGASASMLDDAAKAAGIVGTLADAARKFGLFGGTDAAIVAGDTGPAPTQQDPTFGAAFF